MLSTGIHLLSLTVLGAACLVAHLALLVSVWRAENVPSLERWLALVPPVLPIVAFRAGRKAGVVVWVAFVAGYVALRLVG